MICVCVCTIVENRWGQALNIPKMRHFKQIFPYLRLFNLIRFMDGKFVELLHDIGKTLQREHSNHHTTHKEQVSKQSFRMLTMLYIMNGGKWGLDMEHHLGNRCLNLRDPKDATRLNPAITNFKIPIQSPQQHKFQITGLYDKEREPSTIQQILQHRKTNIFMQFVNHGLDSLNNNLTWKQLINDNNINVRTVKQFRFHQHHSSFVVNFANKHICLMKNNNNQVCKFKRVYLIQYPGNRDILIGYGSIWPIYHSNTTTQWIDNKFNSMDFIDNDDRHAQFFFVTNMQEPIILIHECVSFDNIQSTLPSDWQNVSSHQFYTDFAFNMHKIKQDIQDQPQEAQNRMQCPCGPVFKCKEHHRRHCQQCTTHNEVYSRQKWNVSWQCNTNRNTQYRILDAQNGFNMTLMKTVQSEGRNQY